MSESPLVKRLLWTGLQAALGAGIGVVTQKLAAVVWRQVFDEDPPE